MNDTLKVAKNSKKGNIENMTDKTRTAINCIILSKICYQKLVAYY